jgi:hypothetical protein
LIRGLLQSENHGCSDELFEGGMFRIDRLDHRNVIPLAVLTITMVAASTVLLQVLALRATMQNPLPLAPGRWMAALSTALVMTTLCHMGFICFGSRLEKPLTKT